MKKAEETGKNKQKRLHQKKKKPPHKHAYDPISMRDYMDYMDVQIQKKCKEQKSA